LPAHDDVAATGIELIREVLAFSSFKGAPGSNAEAELDKLIAALREARRALWNDWHDLPVRGSAEVVLHIDQALGESSSRWLARFKQNFPNEWKTELEEALRADT
jgi:hypothetical protein